MIEKENNAPGTKISFSNNTIDQMSVLSNNETQRMADNNNNCRYCELSWINSFSRVRKKYISVSSRNEFIRANARPRNARVLNKREDSIYFQNFH